MPEESDIITRLSGLEESINSLIESAGAGGSTIFDIIDTAQYPALIAMVFIVVLLFRELSKRQKFTTELLKTVNENTNSLNKMTTLLEVLVYGSKRARLLHGETNGEDS